MKKHFVVFALVWLVPLAFSGCRPTEISSECRSPDNPSLPLLNASVYRTDISTLEVCVQNWDSEAVYLLCSPFGFPRVSVGADGKAIVEMKGAETMDGACLRELVANPSGPDTKGAGAWSTHSASIRLEKPLPDSFEWALEVMALRASDFGNPRTPEELWKRFCDNQIRFEGGRARNQSK